METQTKNLSESTTVLGPREARHDQDLPTTVHPHVLLVEWEIHTRAGQWHSACAAAEALIAALPEEPIGWIHHSFALQQLGHLREARMHLLAAARIFPADWRIAYNLACYNCQLGDRAGAWNWLDESIRRGDADVIKSLALNEPSFKPLWEAARARRSQLN